MSVDGAIGWALVWMHRPADLFVFRWQPTHMCEHMKSLLVWAGGESFLFGDFQKNIALNIGSQNHITFIASIFFPWFHLSSSALIFNYIHSVITKYSSSSSIQHSNELFLHWNYKLGFLIQNFAPIETDFESIHLHT